MKNLPFLFFFLLFNIYNLVGQEYIYGNIQNKDTGEALIGVNILLKNTTIGTVTDIDGNFSLDIPEDYTIRPIVLEVSYVGYTQITYTVKAANYRNIKIEMDDGFSDNCLELLILYIYDYADFPELRKMMNEPIYTQLDYVSQNINQGTDLRSITNETPGIRTEQKDFNNSTIHIRGASNQKITVGHIPLYTGLNENYIADLEPLSFQKIHINKNPNPIDGANIGGSIRLIPKFRNPDHFSSQNEIGSNGFLKTSNTIGLNHATYDCYDSYLTINQSFTKSNGFRNNSDFNKHSVTISGKSDWPNNEPIHLFAHYAKVDQSLAGPLNLEAATKNPENANPDWENINSFDQHQTGMIGLSKSFAFLRNGYNGNLINKSSLFGTFREKENLIPTHLLNLSTNTWGGKTEFNYSWQYKLFADAGFEFYQENNIWEIFSPQDLQQVELLNNNKNQKTYYDAFLRGTYRNEHQLEISGGININKTILQRVDLFDSDQANFNQKKSLDLILSPHFRVNYHTDNGLNIYGSVQHGFVRTPTGSIVSINDPNKKFIDPTYSWNAEIGIWQGWESFNVGLSFYSNQRKNLFIPNSTPANDYSGKASYQGLELFLKFDHKFLETFAAYTYSHHRYSSYQINQQPLDGQSIPGIVPHHFNLGFLFKPNGYIGDLDNFKFRINYELIGPRSFGYEQPESVAATHLLQAKLFCNWRLSNDFNLKMHIGANNILNQTYVSQYLVTPILQSTNELQDFHPGLPFHFYTGFKIVFDKY